MPNRILKESINVSRGLSSCAFFSQDLFKRLITYADDYGRFNADTEIMLARLYPRDLDSITQNDIIEALIELSGVGKIQFYTARPRKEIYGCFPNWGDHQRIRDSKKNFPEPGDTSINDWYLRRFVSIDMKAQIIERDGFRCQICGELLTTCNDTKRFVKLGSNLFHIDHIVPCQQGGRATLENLRLTCPSCNLSRKKNFTFDEIVSFAFSPQVAASFCELPPNPIQSESESNPNPIERVSEDAPDGANSRSRKVPFDKIVESYNSVCVSLPKVQNVSDARKRAIRSLWKRAPDLEQITKFFKSAEASDFLTGRDGKWTGCGFDWLIKDANVTKVLEGNYDNKEPTTTQKPRGPDPAKEDKYGDLYAI